MGTFQFQKLDCYIAAKQIAVAVHEAKIGDAELRDQANRAAKSCFLNLSEGLPSHQDGIRKRHFAASRGSLCELAAAIDLAASLGADCVAKEMRPEHHDELGSLLKAAGYEDDETGAYTRYGSARSLYHFHVDNAES